MQNFPQQSFLNPTRNHRNSDYQDLLRNTNSTNAERYINVAAPVSSGHSGTTPTLSNVYINEYYHMKQRQVSEALAKKWRVWSLKGTRTSCHGTIGLNPQVKNALTACQTSFVIKKLKNIRDPQVTKKHIEHQIFRSRKTLASAKRLWNVNQITLDAVTSNQIQIYDHSRKLDLAQKCISRNSHSLCKHRLDSSLELLGKTKKVLCLNKIRYENLQRCIKIRIKKLNTAMKQQTNADDTN